MASPTTRANSYKLAKYALEQNLSSTEFPSEWWDTRPRGSVSATKTPRSILKSYQEAFNKYDDDNKGKYRTFISEIENVEGFIRIVSQNMHCREEGNPTGSTCAGETKFYDNQPERAIELAKRIVSGTMKADVIALQELQSTRARTEFTKEMAKQPRYKVWMPEVYATFYTKAIYAGQLFVYDSTTVKILEKRMWVFPSEISSGADALGRAHSFKGVAWARFETIPKVSGQEKFSFSVFNIHPSPYVEMKDDWKVGTVRSTYDAQIVASHMYQFTLVAMKIKEIILAQRAAGVVDSIFILGDWNVNKFFQNGFTEKLTREDMATAEAKTRSVAANTIMGRGMRTITKKNAAGKVIKNAAGKNVFEVSQVEPCFRDDIPFTGMPECDYTACCGSEYMTCLEILGAIPPTHLYSLSEHDEDIPAPYGGKYTWDGLINSVMWSPYWSSRAFQLLDHIVYSKYGHIPIYAHTMTKRYLTTAPVRVSEGPLSIACGRTLPDNLKFYADGRVHQYVDLADHYAVECVAILSYKDEVASALATSAAKFYTDAKFWADSFYPNFGGAGLPRLQPFMLPKLWQFLKSGSLQNRIRISKGYLGVKPSVKPETLAAHFVSAIGRFKPALAAAAAERAPIIMDYLPSFKALVVNDFAFKMANRLLEREYLNRRFLKDEKISLGKLTCASRGDDIYRCRVTRKARSPRGDFRADVFKKLDIGEMRTFAEAYEALVAGKDRSALARSPDLITTPLAGKDLHLITPTDRRPPTPREAAPATATATAARTPATASEMSRIAAGVAATATAIGAAVKNSDVIEPDEENNDGTPSFFWN